MWGLLRKDLKSLAAQGRVTAIVAIFYVILFFLSEGEDSAAGMLTAMVVLLTILLPVTAVSYDERANWDRYALTMPISRNMLVWSKYLLSAGVALAGCLFLLLLLLLRGQGAEAALLLGGTLGISLFFSALLYPLFFKLGVEKGRYAMLAICLLPSVLLLVLSRMDIHLSLPDGFGVENLLLLLPGAGLLLFFLSGLLSCRIYKKKEF